MRSHSATFERVLAIDPSTRGVGFAVMEGPERLVDWGIKGVKSDKNRESLEHITRLIKRYHPDVIVIENHQHKSARRRVRVRQLLNAIVLFASIGEVRVRKVSRAAIKNAFMKVGAATKHQIATEIARRFPELTPRLPPVRKPWMSEDNRMSIFDSVALALTSLLS